jgi:hypothetical protein
MSESTNDHPAENHTLTNSELDELIGRTQAIIWEIETFLNSVNRIAG